MSNITNQRIPLQVKNNQNIKRTFSHNNTFVISRDSNILSFNENQLGADNQQTDKLARKMITFLSSLSDGPSLRNTRRSSFWGFGGKKEIDIGQIVELSVDDPLHSENSVTKKNSLWIAPFILNPNNMFRQGWDIIFVLTSLLYTALRVPYVIAFNIDEFSTIDGWFVMNRFIDFVFIADMFVIFTTAKQDGRKLIVNRMKIAAAYLKSWFLFDLVSSIPLDVILWLSSGGDSSATRSTKLIRVIKVFRTVRILRLLKLKRIIMTLEIFFGLNFSIMAIFKFVITIALLAHLIACFFLSIDVEHGWMSQMHGEMRHNSGSMYIASLYWAFTTMTTIGYGDIVAITASERVFSTFCMIIGGVTFTYGVTRIVHIVSSMGRTQKNLVDQLENVNEWANYHEFPAVMVSEIKQYLHYKASRSYFDETQVLKGLSVSLRRKVLRFMYEHAMKKVELFKHCSNEFITELMMRMHSEFASPFSIVISQGAVGDCMYIIRRGHCAVYRGNKRTDIQSAVILGTGQAFGEIAVLTDNITRTASVVSLEWTDLAVIKRKDFEELILFFPREQFKMHKYAETKIQNWKLIKEKEWMETQQHMHNLMETQESNINIDVVGIDNNCDQIAAELANDKKLKSVTERIDNDLKLMQESTQKLSEKTEHPRFSISLNASAKAVAFTNVLKQSIIGRKSQKNEDCEIHFRTKEEISVLECTDIISSADPIKIAAHLEKLGKIFGDNLVVVKLRKLLMHLKTLEKAWMNQLRMDALCDAKQIIAKNQANYQNRNIHSSESGDEDNDSNENNSRTLSNLRDEENKTDDQLVNNSVGPLTNVKEKSFERQLNNDIIEIEMENMSGVD